MCPLPCTSGISSKQRKRGICGGFAPSHLIINEMMKSPRCNVGR